MMQIDFDQGSPKLGLAAWIDARGESGGDCSTAGKNCTAAVDNSCIGKSPMRLYRYHLRRGTNSWETKLRSAADLGRPLNGTALFAK